MNARLYDYGSGVFTSTDPLFADMQRAGGLNAYGYVYGNPFSFTDPSGMAGIRWGDATTSGLGVAGNGFGFYAGSLALSVPVVGWVVGPLMMAKSGWGIYTNSHEFGNATIAELMFDNASAHKISNENMSMLRYGASNLDIPMSMESRMIFADGVELLTDLSVGKLPVPKGGFWSSNVDFRNTDVVQDWSIPNVSLSDELSRHSLSLSNSADITFGLQSVQYGLQNGSDLQDYSRKLSDEALQQILVGF